jgi:hypothetical protein
MNGTPIPKPVQKVSMTISFKMGNDFFLFIGLVLKKGG